MVGLRDLVISAPETIVESFMNPNVLTVTTHTDQEDVARLMARYDLAGLPIVDDLGILQGVVTHDHVIDVLEDEATEDVLHLGGIEAGPLINKPYWAQRIPEVVRSPFLWLLGLFVAETLTGSVLRHFQRELEAVVALSFFIPLIIGTGGNAGSQSVTTVIRGLALQEIRPKDVLRVVLREIRSAPCLGCCWASWPSVESSFGVWEWSLPSSSPARFSWSASGPTA